MSKAKDIVDISRGKVPEQPAQAEASSGSNETESISTVTDEQIVDAPISLANEVPKLVEFLPEQLQPYWKLVQQIPLLEALVIITLFWVLAYLIRKYAISLIERLAVKTASDLDDKIVDEVRGPIFSTVVWIGILIGAATATAELENSWPRYITPFILSILVLVWLRVSLALSGIIFTAMSRDVERFKKIDVRTEPLLIIVSKLVLLLVGSYILLIIWGINPVGLLASAGIVGIAVGFAAKDTLANLFSGVFILADRPYKLGDYVNLDTGERGKVTHIGIRSTRVLTRDDIEVTIPNGVIGNAKVVNESGGPYQKMRIRMDVQCSYESDLEEVCATLMAIAEEEDLICKYPSPRVRVRNFADSGISIQLMGWINKPEDRGRIMHILFIKIHQGFKAAGIEIPYPKRDINISSQSDFQISEPDITADQGDEI